MTDKEIAEALLAKFFYQQGVYELGCGASFLNIHAQQQRAFNLVWSLIAADLIRPGLKVAILGGGVSGITAAVGLAAAGVTVTVHERLHKVLTFQSGNFSRYVHPNVAKWPADESGYPLTNLPFMNWRAGKAGDVNQDLKEQWIAAHDWYQSTGKTKLIVNSKIDTKSIKWDRSKQKLDLVENDVPLSYDFIVLAVGYGLEKTDKSTTPSYWRNDDLAQPILDRIEPRKFVVSGNGDGGLTEVLRLKLDDFQHQQFIEEVMFMPQLRAAASKTETSGWKGLWNPNKAELRREYAAFFKRIRSDTQVILNGNDEFPDQTNAQLLHKLCVSLLLAGLEPSELRYQRGELETPVKSGAKYLVTMGTHSEEADVIIQRHGTNSSFAELMGLDDTAMRAHKQSWRKHDSSYPKTYERHYPERGFLADELMPAHFEASYEVGFIANDDENAFHLARAILKKLILPLEELDLSEFRKYRSVFLEWQPGKEFVLRLDQRELVTFNGDDVGTPKRYHHPQKFNLLILHTASKCLLDNLLDDACFPYHLLSFRTNDNFPKKAAIDWLVNTDTGVYLVNRLVSNRSLEVHCSKGMHQAHMLMRVPVLIKLMGNTWPATTLGGLGWAVQNLSEINRRHQRGNELLNRPL